MNLEDFRKKNSPAVVKEGGFIVRGIWDGDWAYACVPFGRFVISMDYAEVFATYEWAKAAAESMPECVTDREVKAVVIRQTQVIELQE